MKYHIFFFLWLIAIFVESSFPSTAFPKVEIFNADKIVHVGVYGLLAFLCYISLIHQRKFKSFYSNPFIWSLFICTLYGASDEFHQYFVPNRSCEFWDWIADFFGVILAILLIKYFLEKRYKLFNLKSGEFNQL